MNLKLRLLLLTLITLLLGGASYAGDTFTISFNGSNVQSTEGYFSWNSARHNFNTKFTDAVYAGISFTSGLKMESATYVNFTSTATSTVIIVQSTWSDKTIKFDETELAVADAEPGTGNCRIYTLTDVEAGAHSITRGSGESGLFYVSVEYTGTVLDVLETPAISFNSITGEVIIAGDANATSIVYTTDGTEPSATNGDVYEAPFTVADGTVVKAIALGDGETFTNSDVATVTVLLEGIAVEEPVIKVVYGTFAITCETPNVTLEYSLDGENWLAYTGPVTLFEDGMAYARATRGNTSKEASAEVVAVPRGDANDTVVLTYADFDLQTVNGLSTLVGKGAAEGYSISLNNSQKTWSYGGSIDGNVSIKLSNGSENTLYLPEGVSATRITFHSYINGATPGRVSGWSVVGGVETQYEDVPMAASANSKADVRVYPLTGEEKQLDFKNAGDQLCFYIVLDVNSSRVKEVILSYTVDETSVSGEDLDATPGKIYFGADKFEQTSYTETGYAYKSDSNAGETSTKYILLKPSRPLAAGDIIEIEAFASSNSNNQTYGFSLYAERGGSAPLTTLHLSGPKNVLQTLSYTVTEGDGFEGLTEIWVFRASGYSTFFYSANIYGYKELKDFSITLGSYGKATFYDSKMAYIIPDGLTASVVESVNNKSITLIPLAGVIPADCGVVLEGEQGEYVLKATIETGTAGENLLRGSDKNVLTVGDESDATYKFYALSVNNGKVAFYWMAANGDAFENEAHKAYLPIKQTSTSTGSNVYYFDTPDGIEDVQLRTLDADAPVYNLSGQRVDGSYKGVVIANGVKVINH